MGAVVGLLLFPLPTAALGLGQANLAIVGCFGLVMGALAQGWGRTAASAVILGAAIKLVPAAALGPVLCSKQGRVLRAAVLAGLGVLVLTWSCVPIDRIIDNFFRTVAFQRGVEPHWLHDFSLPDGLRYLCLLYTSPSPRDRG